MKGDVLGTISISLLLQLGAAISSETVTRVLSARELISPHIGAIAQIPAATQQQRRALVIGNSAYEALPLRNPTNDARDMAATLQELGFEVDLLLDATLPQMEAAAERLNDALRQGGVGMVFFAGHGIQVNGENYLMPIGATVNREQDIRYEAYPLGRLLASLEDAGNDLNIVILDACRNNPFARQWRSSGQGGLAPVQAARGTLIAYATYPGGYADDGPRRNGIYTEALLKHIRSPQNVELMLKRVRADVLAATDERQIPWESSSLVGDFSFNPELETQAPPDAPVPSVPSRPPEASVAESGQEPEEASAPAPVQTTSPTSESAVTDGAADEEIAVAAPTSPEPPANLPGGPGDSGSLPTKTTTAFQSPPRLQTALTTNDTISGRNATYYFTLELPENLGAPLKQVEVQLRERSDPQFRFVPEKTRAFVGTSRDRGAELPIASATHDPETQTLTLVFAPPLLPGQTITLGLKPVRNPRRDNTYLFGITAVPDGDNARSLYLGA